MTMTIKGQLGALAENCAAQYLEKKNYRIVARNYRKPWGEIDIVAEKLAPSGVEGEAHLVLVFVEVKANRREIAGFEPELRVNPAKRHRMARIAKTFLSDYRFPQDQPWQMDIMSVTFVTDKGKVRFCHYKNI